MEKIETSFSQFINVYWLYYRELEEEFLSTRKYVDFSASNYNCFSVEFLKLFQAVCSEIDVLGKRMAEQANPSFRSDDKQNNILKWWYEIQDSYSCVFDCHDENVIQYKLADVELKFINSEIISPWRGFRTEYRLDKKGIQRCFPVKGYDVPQWWQSYNNVKHNRAFAEKNNPNKIMYHKANLENLVLSFGALYILEIAFMIRVATKSEQETFYNPRILFKSDFDPKQEVLNSTLYL